ncbi:3-phosphoinositide-dependent protein kinase 1-related [Anaeramoeba flamelloides]|uniref:3-phosphoinositide-dependent protein kinase 1-related n=1 Tax=Anaeramoeba flamelloides TaxID=1746091 RepID=A0AAV7Z135_9EUKA|nr:3-phosphoinositide-dependent protein kinase 1-related [Anaeramoeba flamelloides]
MNCIQKSDFEIGNRIGLGTYGEIFRVKEKKTGLIYAMKIMNKELVSLYKHEHILKREKELLIKLDHPNIIKYTCSFEDQKNYYFVTELCPKGELSYAIRKYGSIGYKLSRLIISEILVVLEYLYFQTIVHCDLHPENILFSESGHIKLCDFGKAKIIEKGFNNACSKKIQTSEEYIAPETLKEGVVQPESDLWSLGCLIYQMFCGKTLFRSSNEFITYQKILKGEIHYPKYFPSQAKDLVSKLLVTNPDQRIGAKGNFKAIKNHKFFEGVDFTNLASIEPPKINAYLPAFQHSKKKTERKERKLQEYMTIRDNERAKAKKERQHIILKEMAQYEGIEPERVKLLRDQKRKIKYSKYLKTNELITQMGLVYMKRGLFPRKRQLVLTDEPRFLFFDLKKGVKKAEINWSKNIKCDILNKKLLTIITPKRKYRLEDYSKQSQKWKNAFNDMNQQFQKK